MFMQNLICHRLLCRDALPSLKALTSALTQSTHLSQQLPGLLEGGADLDELVRVEVPHTVAIVVGDLGAVTTLALHTVGVT